MRQKAVATQHLVVMYTQNHLTLRQIGAVVGMSGSAVNKRLRKAGITSRDGEWVKTQCGFCGSPLERKRAHVRNNAEVYCNMECYHAQRENPGYKPWRQGQRIARAIVAQHFPLQPDHVVDHIDGDNRNNNLDNLRVYASQSDHIKMHHGKSKVQAIWYGKVELRGYSTP